jgi:hypothetical protein
MDPMHPPNYRPVWDFQSQGVETKPQLLDILTNAWALVSL